MLFPIKHDMNIFETIDKNAASSLFSCPSLNKPTLSNKPPSREKKIIRDYSLVSPHPFIGSKHVFLYIVVIHESYLILAPYILGENYHVILILFI